MSYNPKNLQDEFSDFPKKLRSTKISKAIRTVYTVGPFLMRPFYAYLQIKPPKFFFARFLRLENFKIKFTKMMGHWTYETVRNFFQTKITFRF